MTDPTDPRIYPEIEARWPGDLLAFWSDHAHLIDHDTLMALQAACDKAAVELASARVSLTQAQADDLTYSTCGRPEHAFWISSTGMPRPFCPWCQSELLVDMCREQIERGSSYSSFAKRVGSVLADILAGPTPRAASLLAQPEESTGGH